MASAGQQPPPSTASAGGSKTTPASGMPMPSRNPLPLSASQEAQVREVFNARVRGHCSEEIKAFADCARGRTFSVAFACRELSHRMNNCMAAHATPEEHDRAREEWFAGRGERARERQRKERRKMEQEKFHREWWGLPDKDPVLVAREQEKLNRQERIGGGYDKRREGGGGSDGQASR